MRYGRPAGPSSSAERFAEAAIAAGSSRADAARTARVARTRRPGGEPTATSTRPASPAWRDARRLRVDPEEGAGAERHDLAVDRHRPRPLDDDVDLLLAGRRSSCSRPIVAGRQIEPVDPERARVQTAPDEAHGAARPFALEIVHVHHVVAHRSSSSGSHAKDAERALGHRRVRRGREAEREHAARVERVDDAVVPEPRGRVVRVALRLVGGADLVRIGIADHRQHRRRLLAAHHGDARVRPHPELARLVGTAAHRVVAGAERAAGDDRELRHVRAGHRHHELGAVARDPAGLVLLADHEAGDVLEEDERHATLAGQLDEVRALLRRLGEEHALVRQDRDRVPLDPREAADERLAVERLELGEARAVDDPRDHLARVELVPVVLRDQAVELGRVERGRLGRCDLPRRGRLVAEVADDLADERERVLVVDRVVVGDARLPRVHVGAAELLGGHVLPGRGLHERRAADEDRAGAADDDRLVAHRRHVGAAGRARAHHGRDLRDSGCREPCLVEEDPAEVLAVREDLGLQRQEGAARVDEVDAREPVLRRDLLGAQVLLHREREVRAALHGRVVRDDDALAALDHADPGHDPRRRRGTVVDVPGGERVQLEKRGAGVEQPVDALARGQLAAERCRSSRRARRRRARRARCARAAPRRAPPSARGGSRTRRRAPPAS